MARISTKFAHIHDIERIQTYMHARHTRIRAFTATKREDVRERSY